MSRIVQGSCFRCILRGTSEQLPPFVLSEAKSKDALSHGERRFGPELF